MNPRAPAPPPESQAYDAGADVGMVGAAALFCLHGLALLMVMLHRGTVRYFANPTKRKGRPEQDYPDVLVADDEARIDTKE